MTFVQECLLSLSLLQSLGITQKICHTAESSSWLLLITLQFRFFSFVTLFFHFVSGGVQTGSKV